MILRDACDLLPSGGIIRASSALLQMTPEIRCLQVEPEDSLEMILTVLDQQSRPVLIILPEHGIATFTTAADFAQIQHMQQENRAEVIGFVIPAHQLGIAGRYAHHYHFLFSTNAEKVLQAYVQRVKQGEIDSTQITEAEQQRICNETGEAQATRTASRPLLQGDLSLALNPITPTAEMPKETTQSVPVQPRSPSQLRSRTRLVLIAISFALLILLSATTLTAFFSDQNTALGGAPTNAGILAFSSSGQIDPTNSTGLNDQLSLDLQIQTPPTQGNNYYAWLLPDPGDDSTLPLLLGALSIQNGEARLIYQNPSHTDLLTTYSGFRVTEQSGSTTPTIPSADPATWRLTGHIPNTPNPNDPDHFSLLDHLRHLLAKDPTLQTIGLNGGLDTWLFRNTGDIFEDATAARDDWNTPSATALLRQHVIRVLDYLDGINFVQLDVPAGTPFLVDQNRGHIGLLTMVAGQNPPGYLDHVDLHLQGLANAPGHTVVQQQLAVQIDHALNAVDTYMQSIRQDARQLLPMSTTQLQQQKALSLLNDMVSNSTLAFSGQLDPTTGESTGGIAWIHQKLQGLAVIPITVH